MFIAVDWGTTNARFWLCSEVGAILASTSGKGVSAHSCFAELENSFSHACVQLGSPGPAVPAILCGMAGSTLGLYDAGYAETPIAFARLASAAVPGQIAGRNVRILPGARTPNPLGYTDLMRGEETQLLGLSQDQRARCSLVCLPGTHTKWAKLEEGALISFFTSLTGELYSAIASETILLRGIKQRTVVPCAEFFKGVELVRVNPHVGMDALLFSVRSSRVTGKIDERGLAAFLSGILIGSDVRNALKIYSPSDEVVIIGDLSLASLYQAALGDNGVTSKMIDGTAASLAGLTAAFRSEVP